MATGRPQWEQRRLEAPAQDAREDRSSGYGLLFDSAHIAQHNYLTYVGQSHKENLDNARQNDCKN